MTQAITRPKDCTGGAGTDWDPFHLLLRRLVPLLWCIHQKRELGALLPR